MTPKHKAEELFDKMSTNNGDEYHHCTKYVAIQCALIAVDEILEATKRYDYTLGPKPSYNDYWLKVKYQIEKL
jgi:hypothetical protein